VTLTFNAKLATAALIAGIVAIAYPTWITGPIGAVVAVVCGIQGIRSERRGIAITGLVLAALAMLILVVSVFIDRQLASELEKLKL